MNAPTELLKDVNFKTDLKSMLRGLNSLLGLNMGMRSRLRAIRVDKNNNPMVIASQFDLIKFVLVADKLPQTAKAIKYTESKDEFEFIDSLTGDTKEALFIYEDVDLETYAKELVNEKSVKEKSSHFYKDELSALLDSYQINNGLVYLFHGPNESLYILNRPLSPDPDDNSRFFFYTKLFSISNNIINSSTNFIEINRFDLSVKAHSDLSSADQSQMVLPVIHLHS